jgi:hypothetical protein
MAFWRHAWLTKCQLDVGYKKTRYEPGFGAGNETRTRDFDLGKVALYQLSYSRIVDAAVGFCPLSGVGYCGSSAGLSNQKTQVSKIFSDDENAPLTRP